MKAAFLGFQKNKYLQKVFIVIDVPTGGFKKDRSLDFFNEHI